jgi:hypothetical protein
MRQDAGPAILWLAVAVLAGGCAAPGRPALGTVEGRISLDGSPLPAALVLFTPAGPGRTSQAVSGPDGRYRLRYLRDIPGANVDRHTVRISTATEQHGGRETLPPRYHARTELGADVRPGHNTIDFELVSR